MSLKRLYADTETCGLHSMPVLLQYAVEDGPITLHEIWRQPIRKTLSTIEWMLEHRGFQLVRRKRSGRQERLEYLVDLYYIPRQAS